MIKDLEGLVNKICGELRNFTDIGVVGMSGGADSTLVTTLCVRAFGASDVYGFGMPYGSKDFKVFNSNSKRIAEKLGIKYEDIEIFRAVEEIDLTLRRCLSSLNLGNIKSRIRMIYLYTLCTSIGNLHNLRCRVIGTGNLSEDYIGYDTKGGDALADIFPIGELYKSEVYQLLDFLVEKGYIEEDMIDRVPSAGLEDGQTDEGDLGYTYNEMEPEIKYLQKFGMLYPSANPIRDFVSKRHDTNKHKHEAVPVINLEGFKE